MHYMLFVTFIQLCHVMLFSSSFDDSGFFEGIFLCKDGDVASFVDYIHSRTEHVSLRLLYQPYYTYYLLCSI